MNDPEKAYVIGQAIAKLEDKLFRLRDELRRRESSCGNYHNVRKLNALRAEIESVERRIQRAEKLQDSML